MSITRSRVTVGAIASGVLLVGCASAPEGPPPAPPTEDVLSMTVRTGGVHHCMVIHEGRWYQAFDSSVLVLDPMTGDVANTLQLGTPDHAPPVVDMVLHAGSLLVVLEGDTILRLSIEIPDAPAVVEEIDTTIVGVSPRALSIADGRLFASGIGGVVDLQSRTLVSHSTERAGRVAVAGGELLVPVGRQVLRARDSELLGTATDLYALPESLELSGRLIGVRQRGDGALISLLGDNVREVEGDDSSIAVSGQVRSVRFIDDRMWIVDDETIRICAVTADGITVERRIEVLGARDVARRDENYLLISGAFGRAIYREADDEDGFGDEFLSVHREPSGLIDAVTDRRYLLAGGPMGYWRYLIGQQFAELNQRVITQAQEPVQTAQAPGSTLRFEDDNAAVVITSDGDIWQYREDDDARFHCVAMIEGRYWVGHDRGITVLRPRPTTAPADQEDPMVIRREPSRVLGRLRFEGPVRFFYPLATGNGAAFVSEFGGFGVAEFKPVPISGLPPML